MKNNFKRKADMKIIVNLILILTLIWGCTTRTPSRERFENACSIRLPKEYQVIQDEFQDMMQDFVLYYTIKLDSVSMIELSYSIRHSKYYNYKIYRATHVFKEEYFDSKTDAVWIKAPDGYMFRNKDERHSFSAIIDTIARKADFYESLD
jgi:hypothetical protein